MLNTLFQNKSVRVRFALVYRKAHLIATISESIRTRKQDFFLALAPIAPMRNKDNLLHCYAKVQQNAERYSANLEIERCPHAREKHTLQ